MVVAHSRRIKNCEQCPFWDNCEGICFLYHEERMIHDITGPPPSWCPLRQGAAAVSLTDAAAKTPPETKER